MSDQSQFTHESYLSPFTWRYGTPEMRRLWSEAHKRRLWRRVWVALAEAQQVAGLVTPEQVADLRAFADQVDLDRAHEIEAEIHHDLMAEVRTYAEQARIGGAILHLGATSMDIEDNADALRLRAALEMVLGRSARLLDRFAALSERWADTPAMGFTHLQPAEPTTVGYRFAQYAQDLLLDLALLRQAHEGIRGKGLKGAVGSSASYEQLLQGTGMSPRALEAAVMTRLDLAPFEVATQTYPRKQDWIVLSALSGVAGTLYKFAFDLRLLQSPPIGEWAEPFGSRQVGSSAMPFKRNPIRAEKMDSLARYVASLPAVAWHNAAHSLLERTLDDSANRRVILPQGFLAVDELLRVAEGLLEGLVVREGAVRATLARYGPFAATERVLMEAVRAGADRQVFHEVIRRHALAAWPIVEAGEPNPLLGMLADDPEVTHRVPASRLPALLDAGDYVGDAPERARRLARQAREGRWGRTLLVGRRLFVARGERLRGRDLDSGEVVVDERLHEGHLTTLILTPDEQGIVLHLTPYPDRRGVSNVLRLNLDGAEEWRAQIPDDLRPWQYQTIGSDGERLLGSLPPLQRPLQLDWETGRVDAAGEPA